MLLRFGQQGEHKITTRHTTFISTLAYFWHVIEAPLPKCQFAPRTGGYKENQELRTRGRSPMLSNIFTSQKIFKGGTSEQKINHALA